PKAVRHVVGYIPDTFGLYEEMTVSEYLEFFAGCFDVPSSLRRPMIADLLDLVGLTHRADDDVQTLSRGMRQRLGIARALVHDPLLIVADEPAAGLDPRARVELREILKALQEMGKTIFLSSHVLRELDEIATHVGILEDGQLIATGAVDAIRTRLRPHRRVRIAFAGKHEDAHAWLARHPDVIDIAPLALSRNGGQENRSEQSFDLCVTLRGQTEIVVALLAALVAAGFPVRGYIEEQDSLESLFLNLTRGVVS
ncbi:MAG: ABC transporter ATP-binding protein, partial [Anaerolineae bacterium]|nr:ABC transporter ATP-binding protein [Anaerolineae bacterium]